MSECRLQGQNLQLGYGSQVIIQGLDIAIPDGQFTVIVGPNGCGKSTLLRSLCRLLSPQNGTITLDGQDIHRLPTRQLARQLGLLPQSAEAPAGIRVADLVARGRYPHQRLWQQWCPEDQDAIEAAMTATGVIDLAHTNVDMLSGGQKQRVWIAMALAQATPILLLDEPTTYLDIAHQIELLDLFRQLNRTHQRTLIAVLHDLNQACRYADHLIAVAEGQIVAEGLPVEVITPELVADVFGLECVIVDDPVSHTPLVIPKGTLR